MSKRLNLFILFIILMIFLVINFFLLDIRLTNIETKQDNEINKLNKLNNELTETNINLLIKQCRDLTINYNNYEKK